MHTHTNKLIHETSPYLLQHAHNPVNWFPWGEEALQLAKQENKPILVSIGYAACHWCHVMEKESFEDEATAALMNEKFINIKIDREERPDLDHIYMDAVQAMTGSGGWPLNVFLTPDGKPFYGGTYFPPRRAFNRASWTEVLQGVAEAFRDRRPEIDAQAENLTGHLVQSNSFGIQKNVKADDIFTSEKLDEAASTILKSADTEWGGFGKAPKFPQTFSIQYLLRYSHIKRIQSAPSKPPPKGEASEHSDTSKSFSSSESSQVSPLGGDLEGAGGAALLSLDKMIQGGIYDQLGGGFARYSTDAEWLAPHFEKMLYDNALLVIVLSEAYLLTKKERYREVIGETLAFVERELLHPRKGFYSALDADSEGVEGKFYVWQKREIEDILGGDAGLFCDYYDVSNQGNWEGENILRIKTPLEEFAAQKDMALSSIKEVLQAAREKLLKHREGRPRPLLDDKVILGWNALMNTAYSKAFEATGEEKYRHLAIDNMNFLLEQFKTGAEGEMFHTWKNDKAKYPAFLDDYAFLVQALIQLYEVTASTRWLLEAKGMTDYIIKHFSEEATGFFYFTRDDQADVIVRKKEVYDGAVPSGNSIMAWNLYRLSLYFERADWRERSEGMVSALASAAIKYPTSFGVWNGLLMEMTAGTDEITVVGKSAGETHRKILQEFIPHRVLMATTEEDKSWPLLKNKQATDPASIFLCRNFSCLPPVNTISALMSLIYNTARNN
jgi:uncharacterized protein